MARDKKPASKIDRLLDELMEDGVDAEDLFGEDGLFKRMKKRMAERILEAELTDHSSDFDVRSAFVAFTSRPRCSTVEISYSKGGSPSSFRYVLCFAVDSWICFSISTKSLCVADKSISTSGSAVLT